jgi:adenosine kinase
VTHGGEGSTVFTPDGKIDIPPAPARTVVDPTGCGDAYRAGLLHGLMHGLPWEKTARIASLMGSLKIESRGTQNHSFTMAEFRQRYQNLFGTL